MKHARQTIREAVAALLTGITTALYTSRVYPLVTLPAISVYANSESSDLENEQMPSPIRYSRQLNLEVEVVVEGVSGFDDTLDDYAAQVEAALAADTTLSGTATDSKLTATVITMSGDSDTPTAKANLVYQVWYRTTGTDPENAL